MQGIKITMDGVKRSAFELLSRPEVGPTELISLWPELETLAPDVFEQLMIDAQYSVYTERQRADIEAVRRDEGRAIPDWIDYTAIPGLSLEARQKLDAARPQTIAQAQRLEGMTPAAILLLLAVIRRGYLQKQAS